MSQAPQPPLMGWCGVRLGLDWAGVVQKDRKQGIVSPLLSVVW